MIKLEENILLSKFSNYKIGGPARYFTEVENISELKEAVIWAKENHQPIFILGGGTNLLINDQGFNGLIIKINLFGIELEKDRLVKAGAGVSMSELINFSIKNSLSGLEWAGGLPGTLGGAVRGNAGAFAGEIKDIIRSVESFDTETLETIKRDNTECRFGYRMSIFKEKKGREIILGVVLDLKIGEREKIEQAVQEKIEYRKKYHPLEYPSIGSIFKNVDVKDIPEGLIEKIKAPVKSDPFPVVPVAYIISEAGLKDRREGDALVSPKHPNYIVNVGHATAKNVHDLIDIVKAEVKNKFNITIEEEVQSL